MEDGHIQETRAVIKGSQNTANREVQLHYKDNQDGTVLLRCELLHSFPSDCKTSKHYGYLHPAVLLETKDDPVLGYQVAVRVLDAVCDCTAQGDKSCWHIAGLLTEAQHLVRPPQSPIPMSTTAKQKSFDRPSEGRKEKFALTKPLCMLPTRNNKPANRGKDLSGTRKQTLTGVGGKFAAPGAVYYSAPITPDNLEWRNHPKVIKARKKLHDAIHKATGQRPVAETHWPATVVPLSAFSWVTPICDPEYLRTGKINRTDAVT